MKRITVFWCDEMPESRAKKLTEEEMMDWDEVACSYKTFTHSASKADIIIDSQEKLESVVKDFEKVLKEEKEDIVVAGGTIGLWEGKDEHSLENVDMIDVGSYRDIVRELKGLKDWLK